jgi:hypothetical protein
VQERVTTGGVSSGKKRSPTMLKHLIVALAIVAVPGFALAQDASTGAGNLPAICTAGSGPTSDMPMDSHSHKMGDAAHMDLMDGMDKMNTDMRAGGSAADIDVAFVCSMIPHHRGAIDMAKAELAHGDDPWAKELATGIIAAQEKEIADMLDWLAKQK